MIRSVFSGYLAHVLRFDPIPLFSGTPASITVRAIEPFLHAATKAAMPSIPVALRKSRRRLFTSSQLPSPPWITKLLTWVRSVDVFIGALLRQRSGVVQSRKRVGKPANTSASARRFRRAELL